MTQRKIQPSGLTPQSLSQGNLLGLLTAVFYILFTLLPDSNTLMVEWPWVLFWQVGLLFPVLWWLEMLWQNRLHWLGNRLDWPIGLWILGLLLSTWLTPFPMQARWHSWAVLCCLAALYALSSWLQADGDLSPNRTLRLLTAQGTLNLAFILVSLMLWVSQTYFPEILRLQELRQAGVNLPFDFSNLQLRNSWPIGHQNYVAGYLVLALPLLVGLGIVQKGWQRWVWWVGTGLGLADLYTSNSRAGWLGLLVLAGMGVVALFLRSPVPRRWLGAGSLVGVLALVVLGLTSDRLRGTLINISRGQIGGEVAYRLITITTGWQMGLNHLLFGAGPGSVPLLYQQYRPGWAGREAELHYQLHSTPAQLWAELGLWGVAITGGAIALLSVLAFRCFRTTSAIPSARASILVPFLCSGLLAYAIFSLLDYQLDNLCISGTLIIYVAVLTVEFKQAALSTQPPALSFSPPPSPPLRVSPFLRLPQLTRALPFAGLGFLLVMLIWLIPVHRAWMLSSQGFMALIQDDVNGFVQRLNQSHQLVPWEPYYANQLGWNLGNLSLQVRDPKQQKVLTEDGIAWFQQGLKASPQQEFGHTNLGWLWLNRDPKAATQAFARSAQLLPAKRGVFYGLGVSLLAQGRRDLALQALRLEALRDLPLLTSPLWKLPDFQPLYEPLVSQVEAQYTTLLEANSLSETLAFQLHQSRGGLRWWRGNLSGARADLEQYGTPLSRLVVDLAARKAGQPELAKIPPSEGTLAIAAWFDLAKRKNFLQQAWIVKNRMLPDADTLAQLVTTMGRSPSFDQWLKQNAPSRTYRRERLGFGVLNRHADGPAPVDFLAVVENIPIAQFFDQLMPSFAYAPELDRVLQTERNALLKQVLE